MTTPDLHALAVEITESYTGQNWEINPRLLAIIERVLAKLQQQHEAELAKLRNWSEDFEDENGKYSNQCVCCGHFFLGHKRRVTCKFCVVAYNDAAVAEALERAAQKCETAYWPYPTSTCDAFAAAIRALKPRSDLVCVPRSVLQYVLDDDGLIPRATGECRRIVREALAAAEGKSEKE